MDMCYIVFYVMPLSGKELLCIFKSKRDAISYANKTEVTNGHLIVVEEWVFNGVEGKYKGLAFTKE